MSRRNDRLREDNSSQGGGWWRRVGEGVAEVGLRLDSAAGPPGARRESRDAPFHSPTADIASPFQNISFPNAWSSRWITNLSITSLSYLSAEESRTRRAVCWRFASPRAVFARLPVARRRATSILVKDAEHYCRIRRRNRFERPPTEHPGEGTFPCFDGSNA